MSWYSVTHGGKRYKPAHSTAAALQNFHAGLLASDHDYQPQALAGRAGSLSARRAARPAARRHVAPVADYYNSPVSSASVAKPDESDFAVVAREAADRLNWRRDW